MIEVNIHKPKIDDQIWINHHGHPKELWYDYMYGWIADVDECDRPHTIIDWPFVIFDEFTEEVKEYILNKKHYHEIGFTNEEACYDYCYWEYLGRR